MQEAVIFDIDGTLCNVSPIRYMVKEDSSPEGFDAFYQASLSCEPHEHVLAAAHQAHEDGRAVIVLTARMNEYRDLTLSWLSSSGVPVDELYIRDAEDDRSDVDVKRDLISSIRENFIPVQAWEDKPAVAEMLEQEGIPCTLVPGWEIDFPNHLQ